MNAKKRAVAISILIATVLLGVINVYGVAIMEQGIKEKHRVELMQASEKARAEARAEAIKEIRQEAIKAGAGGWHNVPEQKENKFLFYNYKKLLQYLQMMQQRQG